MILNTQQVGLYNSATKAVSPQPLTHLAPDSVLSIQSEEKKRSPVIPLDPDLKTQVDSTFHSS